MQPELKNKRLPLILPVCLLLVLVTTIFYAPQSVSRATETLANDPVATEMTPGSSIQSKLPAGAKAIFLVSVTGGSLFRLSVDKGDLILSTALYGPTGAKLLEHFSQDFEIVDLSFPAQITGSYRIELLSREKAEARQFEIKLQPLTPVAPKNQKDSEARQALAQAEVLRAEWTETAFRKAIEQCDHSVQIWLSLSDFGNASYANLESGDLLFDLSEYPEAFQRYQNAKEFAGKTDNWLAKATALGRIGRVESYTGKNIPAQQHLREALDLFTQHKDNLSANAANAYGDALNAQAEVFYSRGNFVEVRRQSKEALKAFQGDRKGEANAHLLLAQVAGTMGFPEEAANDSSRALELYRAIGNKRGEALAFASLGLTYSFHRESRAIELYQQARNIFRLLGDKTSEAIVLNGLGQASENLHDTEAALNYYEQALELFQNKGVKDAVTNSLLKIAGIYFVKDLDKALVYDKRCLKLSKEMGNARTEAMTRTEIARVYTAKKDYALASIEYRKVLRFFESTNDLRGQATALNPYGDFLLQIGEGQKAVGSYERALSLSEQVDEKELHISTLYNLARAHLQLGSPEDALPVIERSLQEIEALRASVEGPDFRASYFSGVQRNYKLCIETLMRLDRLHPGKGFDIEALLVSENSRARLLRELVIESQAVIRDGASNALVQRERELRGLFRVQAQYRLKLSPEGKDSAEVAALDRQLAQLRTDYQEVEAQLRQQMPVLASLSEPITLDQIQHELHDDKTMLLEYSLDDERSYLFAVTSNSLHAYELPARKLLEDAVHECNQLMTARQQDPLDVNYQAKVEAADNLLSQKEKNLSQMLLGPVADKLGTRRLLIVAEGALQSVSFEPLPVPLGHTDGPRASEGTSKALINTNEIVCEPSMSTLAMIRKTQNHKSSPTKLVAVIADPVFSGTDERVQTASHSADTALAAANSNSDQSLPRSFAMPMRDGAPTRLVHASEEADAIAAAAPWGTTLVAKGFAANRETAMSSEVGQYQIIHFATHGLFNSEHPELSGIVLTMVDRNGASTDGVMPLQDIYNLDLSAELTVLSACQTALGRDVKGEGFVGLTHSFLSAGSRSVVASLWNVDDRATAALMTEFYDSMLQEGISPAAALRSAKLKMMHDKRWSAPYYWAGFVLEGEYENHIAVGHQSSVRLTLLLLFLLSLSTAGFVLYQKRKRRSSPPQSS